MPCLPSEVSIVNCDHFTSEEVIERAIQGLLEKRRLVDASIEVFRKRLRYIQGMSKEVTSEQYRYMRSLRESSTNPVLPIREHTSTVLPIRESVIA